MYFNSGSTTLPIRTVFFCFFLLLSKITFYFVGLSPLPGVQADLCDVYHLISFCWIFCLSFVTGLGLAWRQFSSFCSQMLLPYPPLTLNFSNFLCRISSLHCCAWLISILVISCGFFHEFLDLLMNARFLTLQGEAPFETHNTVK